MTAVSFPRLTHVELRKAVDTRAGFWLQATVALITLAAVVIVCIVAEPKELALSQLFALAIAPGAILLPIVGILLVSSEWSQRTNLITFTLVPKRMRVMAAKVAAGLLLGLAVCAIGLVLAMIASAAVGSEFSLSFALGFQIVVLVLTAMVTGIAFGAAFLSSAPAIVLSFALPIAWSALGSIPALEPIARWLDTSRTSDPLTDHALSGLEWARFWTSMALWMVLPLVIGLWRIGRGEIRAA
jgi:ABC-2 type transport system permease protein